MRRGIIAAALAALSLTSLTTVWAASPQLTVTAPTDGQTINGTSVTVQFTVSDHNLVPTNVPVPEAGMHPELRKEGEGHVHINLDSFPLVIYSSPQPYTFNDVPPGEHLLRMELIQTDHAPLDTPVVREVRFRTVALVPRSGEPGAAAAARLALGALAVLALLAGTGWGRLSGTSRRRQASDA